MDVRQELKWRALEEKVLKLERIISGLHDRQYNQFKVDAAYQTAIKELQSRIEELELELDKWKMRSASLEEKIVL